MLGILLRFKRSIKLHFICLSKYYRPHIIAGDCGAEMNAASIGTPALWIGFTAFILAMLALDLGVFHRKAHAVKTREALIWSIIWISLALLFNAGVYFWFGPERALEFLTGYLIEKALSVDNLFVFLVLFSYFAVPAPLQHRVLFWGIVGALVMRAGFIVAGAALIQNISLGDLHFRRFSGIYRHQASGCP